MAKTLAKELRERLQELYPDAEWRVPVVTDGLVTPPASTTELIDACHERLLSEDWEMAVCLTDLPLRIGRRAIVGHASPTHRVALVSIPALGAARLTRRALDTAVGLINIVLGEDVGLVPEPTAADNRQLTRLRRRLVELAELADEDPERGPNGLAALVRGGRLRLLGGMVRANRPWRLTARLYRALVAALATVAFAIVTPDIWGVSASLNAVRLTILTVLSILVTVASLVAVHGLWQRDDSGKAPDQVLLFNAATALTVTLGVLSLYLGVLVLALAGAVLVITPDAFADRIGSDVGVSDYLQLAWFVSSLATVGGALGAGLESNEAIKEAAYAYRPATDADWSARGASG